MLQRGLQQSPSSKQYERGVELNSWEIQEYESARKVYKPEPGTIHQCRDTMGPSALAERKSSWSQALGACFGFAWEKASASGGLKESHMAECLHSLACFYDTVSTADIFMTKNEAQAAFSQIKKCLKHYTWLKANAGNDILFQLTPKFHWAYHLGYMCQWQNQNLLDI